MKCITQSEPDQDQMIEWMKKEFPQAKSDKTIISYIRVLKTLRFIRFDGEIIKPTDAGTQSLEDKPEEAVLDQLKLHVAGVEEYMKELSKRSMTFQDSHDFFKDTLSVEWETDYQTKMRLIWLENVGVIRKMDEFFSLA